jgi:transposase
MADYSICGREAFAVSLRHYLEGHGLSVDQLADESKVASSTIHNWLAAPERVKAGQSPVNPSRDQLDEACA